MSSDSVRNPWRDRGAEWSGRGTLGVDVNPLVIVGGVGEGVDLILADLRHSLYPDDAVSRSTRDAARSCSPDHWSFMLRRGSR